MKETKFKQTEVGLIPSDWEVKFLGNLCKNISSGKNKQRIDSGRYAVYGSTGIIGHSDKYYYDGEAILIARVGANAGFLNKAIGKYDVSDNTLIIEQLRANIDFTLEYLKFYNLNKLVFGSGQPLITGGQVKALQIPLPPTTEEQKRIAQALSDIDAVISTTEKLIAKKKALKQGTMQTLLSGKMRIQNGKWIKTTHFKQTELGPIPQEWEVKPMESLIKDISDGPFGSNLKTEHYTSKQEARIVQLSNVGEDGWNDENVKYTTFSHAKDLARCIVPYGAIIIAKMMPAGRSIICPDDEKMYILGSDCVKFIPNDSLNSKYFIYFSKCDFYLKQIADNTQGSTRARTSVSKLKKIQVLLPSKPEQTAIATVLSDMDSEIAALETKLAKYRQLKNGMMQQLLTGKIRLV